MDIFSNSFAREFGPDTEACATFLNLDVLCCNSNFHEHNVDRFRSYWRHTKSDRSHCVGTVVREQKVVELSSAKQVTVNKRRT